MRKIKNRSNALIFVIRKVRLLVRVMCILILIFWVSGGDAVSPLDKMRKEASQDGVYQEPNQKELQQVEALFEQTLLGEESFTTLQREWQKLNFDLLTVQDNDEVYWVLKESETHKTGRGFYIFRVGTTSALILQAPHCFFDLETGTIALKLFQENRIKASAWNTVHRRQADFAHLPSSYLQSFTYAFAKRYQKGIVLQLHGFSRARRKSSAGTQSDIIISNGTRYPAPWFLQATDCLKRQTKEQVKVYPHMVSELGALTNKQGQGLRQLKHDGFVHLEMSLNLRERILKRENWSMRHNLLRCLIQSRSD